MNLGDEAVRDLNRAACCIDVGWTQISREENISANREVLETIYKEAAKDFASRDSNV